VPPIINDPISLKLEGFSFITSATGSLTALSLLEQLDSKLIIKKLRHNFSLCGCLV
jgi:hypothetical protein